MAITGASSSVFSQQLTCATRNYVPLNLRSEGLTELLGDMVVVCTGGTPTAAGAAIASMDIAVTLPVPVTNRKNSGDNFIDALLVVDEPHSPANPNIPLLPCVDCTMTGTGNGQGVYNGSAGRFNVFQGELLSSNSIRFRVPLDPPGIGNSRTLRITNIRVNATSMAGKTPNTIIGTISIPGATVTPATQMLGVVHPTLRFNTRFPSTTGALSACPNGLEIKVTDQETGDYRPDMILRLEEGSATALRPRNISQSQASGPSNFFASVYAADANQDVVGYPYLSESGLFAGSAVTPSAPIPQLAPSASFGAARGLNRAGLATQGTRFYVRFTNASALTISLPVNLHLSSQDAIGSAAGGRAIMIASDGQGAFTAVAGDAKGRAAIPHNGSTAVAIYEVMSADINTPETITIPVYTSQGSAPAGSPLAVQVSVGIGPTSSVTGPDATAPIPRFAENAESMIGFNVSGLNCDLRDVKAQLSSIGGSRGGSGSLSVVVGNFGNLATSGPIGVSITIPSGITPTEILAPAPWNCSLQTLSCALTETLGRGESRFFSLGFSVAASAPLVAKFSVTVSGGGDQVVGNNIVALDVFTASTWSGLGYTEPSGFVYSIDDTWRVAPAPISGSSGTTPVYNTLDRQYQYPGVSADLQSWRNGVPIFSPSPGPMVCTLQTGVPPLVRAEGKAESVGDLSLDCTGGIPTPIGNSVPKADLRFSLSSVVPSRKLESNFVDSLLIVDDPASSTNPQVPLLACGASGSGDNGNGVCSLIASGSVTYNGSSGHPNVFQGRLETGNTMLFAQVPIDPPGPGKTRKLRITNVRANASLIPVSMDLVPSMIAGTLSFDPPNTAVWMNPNSQTVAFMQRSLMYVAPSRSVLSQCTGANTQIVADGSKPLGSGSGNGYQANVPIPEGFPSVFREKSWSTKSANTGAVISYPPDAKQNMPGAIYQTETQFYAGPGLPVDPNFFPPPVPVASPDFPPIRGLDRAGKADAGARVYVRFAGVPAGVKLFVPSKLNVNSTFGSVTGVAQLTATNGSGGGVFSPISGNSSGVAEVAIAGGEGMAVYEILRADAFTNERVSVPVAAAFLPGQVSSGQITYRIGMAPYVGPAGDGADATSPVPRFASFRAPLSDGLIEIASCAQPDLALTLSRSGSRDTTGSTIHTFTVSNTGAATTSGPIGLNISRTPDGSSQTVSGTGWNCVTVTVTSCTRQDSLAPGTAFPPVVIQLGPVLNDAKSYTIEATVGLAGEANTANNSVRDESPVARGGMGFVPLSTPCRAVDTRSGNGGRVAGLSTRNFTLAATCGLPVVNSPENARAYVLNVTVVPRVTLGYLTIWPAGQERPLASTLNAVDGRVKANAAIVPAGANGAVSVFVTDDTDLIIDVTGYFAETASTYFNPVPPCRISDTRNAPGTFGGPGLIASTARQIPVRSAPGCALPATAEAYSLNATVVPPAPVGYLTLFNPDLPFPVVSTLNAVTGTVTANAAILKGSASAGGSIGAFTDLAAHLILDMNGYFASSAAQPTGLRFYPVNPCRISDTRNVAGPFGGPALAAVAERVFNIPTSGCGIPATAKAYSLNATVIPNGSVFGYLTLWPTGLVQPLVSTLNAVDGAITSNAAIVPAGTSGAISVFGSNAAHLILDINGYFAP